MTTESTPSQSELGSTSDNGQGQSQGHRRRRRRRKNKSGSQQSAPQAQQPQMQSPPPAQPPQPAQPKAAAPRPAQQRKKKKPYQKAPSQSAQPGNSLAQPQNRRKGGKPRGPREFVGPMDHSYRIANGNIADGPPSTIPVSGNGHSGYYQETYTTPAPIRENAPTRIFCFIEDLFFLAKIQETARKLGVKVEFIKGDKETVARLIDLPEDERPALLVFDLNNLNAKPMTLIPKFKTKFRRATSIVGFLSHLQGDLKLKAIEAGCDTVMPRSAFSQSLPSMLRRYGLEEEEEYIPQPV